MRLFRILFLTLVLLLVSLLVIKLRSQPYTLNLKNKIQFNDFCGLPLTGKYGNVTAIKVVYDMESERTYYVNSKHSKYHFTFCENELGFLGGVVEFNQNNYSNTPKRKYLLANINYFENLKRYSVEFSPVDRITVKQVEFLYDKILETSFLNDSLSILLNSPHLQMQRSALGKFATTLYPSEIYRKTNYQAISKHRNSGKLVFADSVTDSFENVGKNDILVLKNIPNRLPDVAGVIVTEFQTPLSHLCILGQNRKIPICAYKNAFEDRAVTELNGQLVSLSVLQHKFVLTPLRAQEFRQRSKRKTIKLKYNLEVDSIIEVRYLHRKSCSYVGNKAANFGELHRFSRKMQFRTPESAFAIPFYFYFQHVRESGAQNLIRTLLNHRKSFSEDSIRIQLKKIRTLIKNAQVDSTLVASVNSKIESLGKYRRMRFRSSTNAEDAKGFSGAGLYKSKTGIVGSSEKPVELAMKKVWASLWSYKAFAEREYFGIDHEQCYMGILVHRSFPNEAVNGVAITKNIYRQGAFGFVVNAQLGDESVVNPANGNISDQFICYPKIKENIFKDRITVDIITISNLNNGKLVMREDEIQQLANQLEKIKRAFHAKEFFAKSYVDYGLDVEFKLDGKDRQLYIKQVRLFND